MSSNEFFEFGDINVRVADIKAYGIQGNVRMADISCELRTREFNRRPRFPDIEFTFKGLIRDVRAGITQNKVVVSISERSLRSEYATLKKDHEQLHLFVDSNDGRRHTYFGQPEHIYAYKDDLDSILKVKQTSA